MLLNALILIVVSAATALVALQAYRARLRAKNDASRCRSPGAQRDPSVPHSETESTLLAGDHEKLEWLIESLQLLALPHDLQVACFPDFVHVPDELAITFSDSLEVAEQTLPFAELSQPARDKLHALDRRVGTLSGSHNAPFWTLTAVAHDPIWQEIRVSAAEIPHLLGRQTTQPKLAWMTFVQTDPPA